MSQQKSQGAPSRVKYYIESKNIINNKIRLIANISIFASL